MLSFTVIPSFTEDLPTRGFDVYYNRIRTEGLVWNRKRVLRVYRGMKLGMRRRHKKRVPTRIQQPLETPGCPEQDSKGVFRRHKILSFSVLSVDSRSPAGVTIRGYGRGYDFQPISTVVALTSHYNNRTSS